MLEASQEIDRQDGRVLCRSRQQGTLLVTFVHRRAGMQAFQGRGREDILRHILWCTCKVIGIRRRVIAQSVRLFHEAFPCKAR